LLRVTAILVAALVPLVVEPSLIAVLFAAIGAAYVVVTVTHRSQPGWIERTADAAMLWFDAGWRALAALSGVSAWGSPGARRRQVARAAIAWVLPLALGTVFLLLFTSANPF